MEVRPSQAISIDPFAAQYFSLYVGILVAKLRPAAKSMKSLVKASSHHDAEGKPDVRAWDKACVFEQAQLAAREPSQCADALASL
jgi:hypothetical protein